MTKNVTFYDPRPGFLEAAFPLKKPIKKVAYHLDHSHNKNCSLEDALNIHLAVKKVNGTAKVRDGYTTLEFYRLLRYAPS